MPIITSATTAPSAATVLVNNWWIRDLQDSSLDMAIDVSSVPLEIDTDEQQAVFHPLGRREPIVVTDMISADVLKTEFMVYSVQELLKFKALRQKQRTQLLQSPYGQRWYFRFARQLKQKTHNTNPPHFTLTIDLLEVSNPLNVYGLG